MKRKFKELPSGIKTKFNFFGLIIALLIGLAGDEYDFYFDEDFFIPFGICLLVYIVFVRVIGAGSYYGYNTIKDWLKKAIIGGSIFLSIFIAFIIEDFDFYFDEDFFIPLSILLIGFYASSSIFFWVYDSYKHEKL